MMFLFADYSRQAADRADWLDEGALQNQSCRPRALGEHRAGLTHDMHYD